MKLATAAILTAGVLAAGSHMAPNGPATAAAKAVTPTTASAQR
ncbi:MAG TPA: hypothetical protein VKG03_00525 [Solirubrobacterales bacterium]|nr:hypothetical protein [Solirubrobacterales bacterium]